MNAKKLWALLLAVAMMAMIFAGCSNNATTTTPAAADGEDETTTAAAAEGENTPSGDNILKMGLDGYTGIFCPVATDNVYDDYVNALVFEGLVMTNAEGQYVPNLAASEPTISDDHREYTFTLKDGIKFSDGTDLTAEDVAFTYTTIAQPYYEGPRAYVVAGLEGYDAFHDGSADTFPGVEVVDAKTIKFTFAEGYESPSNIENFSYGIMSKTYYAHTSWDELKNLFEKPMGSGPMIFDGWAPKQYIKVSKNTNYWDPDNAAKIDGVLMNNVPETSMIQALQTGEIDFAMPAASAENLAAMQALDNINVQSYMGNGYTYMCFNTVRKGIDDVRVRQALMYALDRDSFIAAEYGEGLAEVGVAPFSPVSWAVEKADSLNTYPYDQEKAAALMDEAGWTMGDDGFRYKDGEKLKLTWLVYTDSSWPVTLSSMAADTWKQLGVDLDIQLMDFDTVMEKTMDTEIDDRDFDIYTMGFSLTVDPDLTGALFDYDAYVKGGFNASGYYNEEVQKLIKQGATTFDTEARKDIYAELAEILNEQLPTVIIAYRNEIWGVSKRVSGMELGTYQDWTACIKDITLS